MTEENCDGCNIKQLPKLELHISERTIQTGSLQISWCLDKELLQKLTEHKVKDPCLLLSIIPLDIPQQPHNRPNGEHRHLVPLKDLMTFIELKYPGKNAIIGTVIWGDFRHKNFMDKSRHGYINTIYWISRNCIDVDISDSAFMPFNIKHNDTIVSPVQSRIDIIVPNGIFAKEPAEWEKQWVNMWFFRKPIDQCEFRKRRILAYTIQPIAFLFVMLFRWAVCLFLLLIAARGISFKPLFNPLIPSGVIWNDCEGRSWLVPQWEMPYKILFVPFFPLSLILLGILFYFKWQFAIAVFVLWYVMLFCLHGFFYYVDNSKKLKTWLNKLENNKKEKEIKLWQNEIEYLTCETGKQYLSINDLPKKHRTLRLRFQDFKSKVCRPFAGS